MTPAPILVPWEPDLVFLWGDAGHARERLWRQQEQDLSPVWRPVTLAPLTIGVERREYESSIVGRVIVFHTDEDAPRMLAALRLAEAAVVFAVWLLAMCPSVPTATPYDHVDTYLDDRLARDVADVLRRAGVDVMSEEQIVAAIFRREDPRDIARVRDVVDRCGEKRHVWRDGAGYHLGRRPT